MLCVSVAPIGSSIGLDSQASPETLTRAVLIVDSSQASPCPGYVLMTADEAQQFASPFNLPLDSGASIAGAVMACWAVGWGIRMIIRALRDSDSPIDSD